MSKSGIHTENAHQIDTCKYRIGGFTWAKFMWYHTPEEVRSVQRALPGVRGIVRLEDSGPYRNDLAEYIRRGSNLIGVSLSLGIVMFQVDNEPQEQEQWQDPWLWRWFTEQALITWQHRFPQAMFILTPLSWGPKHWDTLEQWKQMLVWHDPKNLAHRSLAQRCAFAGANVYWQTHLEETIPSKRYRQLYDRMFGRSFDIIHELTGLDVVVLEYGDALPDLEPQPSPEDMQAEYARSYPLFLQMVGQVPHVVCACMFIMGGEGRWRLRWPSDPVLRAVAPYGGN